MKLETSKEQQLKSTVYKIALVSSYQINKRLLITSTTFLINQELLNLTIMIENIRLKIATWFLSIFLSDL